MIWFSVNKKKKKPYVKIYNKYWLHQRQTSFKQYILLSIIILIIFSHIKIKNTVVRLIDK